QSQLGGAQSQSDAARQEIAARERERDRASRSLAAMREELAMNRQLEREQYVHRARLMTLERAVSDYEAQVASAEAEISQARQRLRGFEAQAGSQREARRQAAAEELREVEVRLADTEQRLHASRDDQQRQRVLAPVAGRLINLRVNTPGSAVGPREPLVEIVPADAPVLIEARLALDEAADVHPGLSADIRLAGQQARHQRLWPVEVVQVAADAREDERSGRPYVTVLLRARADAGVDMPPLLPGQAAEVYLKVSERTPLGFLAEPVAGFFRRAFRGA
ncbi:MAG: HlyD family efflux transporter periplasmic adaptor subunit, partial [Burkholderiales bacterium]|nr:HlyD family efflux transporter periplasmic adaptor subunit [Burkholderiales bacterium]